MHKIFVGLFLTVAVSLGYAAGPATFVGKSTVLIGRTSINQISVEAPFDAQYQYVVSPSAPSSALYTASSCPSGTNWWGCAYGGNGTGGLIPTVQARAAQATYLGAPHPQRVMWTWFQLPFLAHVNVWQDEVEAVNQVGPLTKYMNDYRFFLQKIGTSHDMIDLEPDFFGFARGYGPVDQVPAQVTAANPTDCANQPNTVAGLSRCLIAMTRKYAPNTAVGLHLTCWDWPGNVDKCARDYVTLGGKGADFLVGEVEGGDAAFNALPENGGVATFWSDQKWAAQLAYWKQMAEAVGHPIVVWQIPVGNMAQNNTPYHYQDDKVDWLFSHMSQVASAHVAALFFGQGTDKSTTVDTDGGNLFAKTIAYQANPAPLVGINAYDDPDVFGFAAKTGVALATVATSSSITVTGLNAAAPISIVAGTYSINGGAYTASAGSVNTGDTVTVRQTSSASYSTATVSKLTIGHESALFNVTTLAAPVSPPPTTATIPTLTSTPTIPGLTVTTTPLNMGADEGPSFMADLVRLLSIAVGMPLQYVEQNAQGTVTLSGFKGGNLAFVPSNFQNAGDTRANGVYPMGDGRYQVVRNGQTLVIAPALVRLDQLTALFSGISASLGSNGVLSASINGQTYAVQPGVAVQRDKASGSAKLSLGSDGFWHFIDALGNNQILYPAFADTGALRSSLLGLDAGAALSVQLDGTASIVFKGLGYTLQPDLTLTNVPLDRASKAWWQDNANRYWIVNGQPVGSAQGMTLKAP